MSSLFSPSFYKQRHENKKNLWVYLLLGLGGGGSNEEGGGELHFLCFFFYKMFMIRVAMGAVKIRIDLEASPFRGDAYFEGPGAQKKHFLIMKFLLDK